ncbi:hypothetical protein SCHPADRAFT_142885 [Schizopora paradoxa]|uniref:Chromo domain-containing protein n=1 Tax=Schizopora paradoxa TaxID=27342 RepID=A0A0H2S8P4_9AGAM|nr:hypothetical protein SCHPADRAFT_142885 [Schizopora paradoxa]
MAKHDEVVPSTPDEEEIEEVNKKKKKTNGKDDDGKSASPTEEVEDGDEEEGDEEEYEIESILDAKRGYFEGKKFGYLVSWKGYSKEHNSWVNEDDAGNAEILIEEFWKKRNAEEKKKKTTRKSEPVSAKPRKSIDKDPSPRAESASTKRGRGRSRKDASEEVQSAEEEEENPRSKKKKQATREESTSKAGRKSLSSLAKDTDQDGDVTMLNGDELPQQSYTNAKAMKNFTSLKSWEDKVESVTTVERVGDDLMVYFVTVTGEYVRENSILCAQKFPQKLIKFYESHLRWRIAGAED